MQTPLISQEIYLLERYSSAAYFNVMADAWTKMVATAEIALKQFMEQLPSDYRNRHLSMQPDIVWGERVLPNFRKTLEALDSGRIRVAAGDLSALGYSHSVTNDARGQSTDYPAEWMGGGLEKEFWDWQFAADLLATNIAITERSGWYQSDLSSGFDEPSRGALNPPASWPIYKLNHAVTVKTGDEVKQNGIYLPDCDDSCASLLIEGYEAFDAEIGRDPKTTHSLRREATVWTLVERVADSGGRTPAKFDTPAPALVQIRVEAGQLCLQSGYYFTPAQTGSRRYFNKGESMPSFGGDYGVTIWQWDAQQG